MPESDVVIIGAGIVGLATAYRLSERYPDLRTTVLEKEKEVGMHQTGHNSGVLHSGIYYKPGSLKAVNCRQGKLAMEAFCKAEGIPFERCGKIIVAVEEKDLPALERIFERGKANGVACEMIGPERLRELEPHAAGIRAIHVPEAGIVNYRQVCRRLAEIVTSRGGTIPTGKAVASMQRKASSVVLQAGDYEAEARYVVNCAGLQSDRVAALSGQQLEAMIVPFRGEYYAVKPRAHHLCRNLIYPVPDPAFPFLGVHFTRMIEGGVECGPNAVLALAREGYKKSDVNLHDLAETLGYSGFRKIAARYWRTGLAEIWRSWSKAAFVTALQRLVPEIREGDLEPAPSGVRAQAIAPDGSMVDDFLIQENDRVINVCNAPSPAATAALNIGRHIVDRLSARME